MERKAKKKAAPRKRRDNREDGRLTVMQESFVQAYCENGFNATQAAKVARYKLRNAASQGSNLLKLPKVEKAIRARLTAAGVLKEFVRIALADLAFRSDLADASDFIQGTKTLAQLRKAGVDTKLIQAATSRVSVEGSAYGVRMYSRLSALATLARVLGMGKEEGEGDDWDKRLIQLEEDAGDEADGTI